MKKSIILSLLLAVCLVSCGGRGISKPKTGSGTQTATAYGYKIINSYPHDTDAYTQGLFWSDGALWESTGEYGYSTLRQVELETGKVTRETALSRYYFAEGSALLGGKIWLLTWLEGKCFVYDPATLERTGEFDYKGEGWGLTTDGEKLYMSDGTPNIVVRDPATFRAERTIVVRKDGRSVQDINELEWIEGKIWANVWMTNHILIIDPESGNVEGIIDFAGIGSRLTVTRATDVMNGIAYDPAAKRIFVTGKRWNRLFEIGIFKK